MADDDDGRRRGLLLDHIHPPTAFKAHQPAMHRSCIRCLSTSARSLVSQASTSASSSILPEHLKSRPVVPELKHVEPQLRELLLNPLRHTAVYYGNNPGALPSLWAMALLYVVDS